MTRPPIDAILDACLEEILQGRSTIEACLQRWPEERAELGPLLRAAVALVEASQPQVVPDPARRAAFMAALAATPQQPARRRLRMPSLPMLSLHALSFGGAMPRFAVVAGVAAVAFIFILAVSLMRGGTSTASAATLTVFAGDVEQRADGAWQAVDDGASLDEGASIRTGLDGRALVTFGDGSTASLEPGTEITLTRVLLGSARQIEIGQASGRLWNDVVTSASASYFVRTPHALIEAHGTVFETVVDTETSVATAEGAVQVVTPDASVDVLRGQVVHATAMALGQPEDVPLIGEITLRAPVAGTITSVDGAATGIFPTGVIVQQVPGITTTSVEEGPQHIFVGSVEPGVYSLWLRRFGDGEGVVVIETPSGRAEIPVPADVTSGRIGLAIDIVDGGVFMRALDTQLQTDVEEPEVRVVETERTREAVDLAVVARARPAATAEVTRRDDGDGDGRGDDDRDDGDRRNDDDDRDDDRGDDRGGRGRRDDGRDRTATPGPTPTATPTRGVDGDRFRSFDDRLETALDHALAGDDSALRAALDDLLGEDRRTDADRLDDLADAIEDDPAALAIVIAVVSTGGAPEFSAELPGALEEVDRDLRRRLERAFAGMDLTGGISGRDDRDGTRQGDDRNDPDDDRGGWWRWR